MGVVPVDLLLKTTCRTVTQTASGVNRRELPRSPLGVEERLSIVGHHVFFNSENIVAFLQRPDSKPSSLCGDKWIVEWMVLCWMTDRLRIRGLHVWGIILEQVGHPTYIVQYVPDKETLNYSTVDYSIVESPTYTCTVHTERTVKATARLVPSYL